MAKRVRGANGDDNGGSSSDDGSVPAVGAPNGNAGALIGTDQLADLLDTISKVRQLIGEKTDISVPGAFPTGFTAALTKFRAV